MEQQWQEGSMSLPIQQQMAVLVQGIDIVMPCAVVYVCLCV